MKMFQRKLLNPFNGTDKDFDCDIKCDQCNNLPNYYVEWSDSYGDYGDTGFYCERHSPAPKVVEVSPEDSKEWGEFVANAIKSNHQERISN